MRQTILVADDDENDRFFVRREFAKLAPPPELKFVPDGEKALAYLKGEGEFSDRINCPAPSVIFLDLKMPRLNGFEVLEWIRRHEPIRRIPVVVLSSSSAQEDIDKAYGLGANAYLVKPADVVEFQKLFRTTGEFFLDHAETPSLPRPA